MRASFLARSSAAAKFQLRNVINSRYRMRFKEFNWQAGDLRKMGYSFQVLANTIDKSLVYGIMPVLELKYFQGKVIKFLIRSN